MSRRVRAAIIDDEPLARARLSRLLAAEGDVDVVAEYADGAEAAVGLAGTAADVAFVDVRMPHVDGFAMLERLPPARRPLVVFVTAYSAHALQAFDVAAIDYLVKPVAPERLHASVARVRRQLAAEAADPVPAAEDYPQRLAVPDGQRLRVIRVDDIEYVRAQGNYLELHLDGRTLLLRETMAGFTRRLDPRRFVRIHRSRIVRIDMIDQVEPYGAAQYWLRLRNGTCMTSGRSYREQLRWALGLTPGLPPRGGEPPQAR